MRKLFCVFVVSVLFTACQDEILVKQEETRHVTDVNRQESIKENDGITYQDRKFFINSVDRQAYTLTRSIGESMLRRTFSVYAEKDGSYYLGVHIMPVGTTSKEVHSIQDVYVYVNSMLFGELSQSKLEWEFVTLKNNAPIRLKKGLNEITFMSAAPYYPEVDAIQVEADFSRLMFNDVLYDDYIKYLKASNSGSNEKIEQGIVDEELRRIEKPANTRSVINPSYSWQVTPSVLSNPDGNYVHKLNVPVTYTYHRKLSLAAGNYTFHTSAVESGLESSVDPIMCLYKIDDPHNYCFVNDDYTGMGLHSKVIANNLPAGDYYLVVRAYSSAYSSTTTGRQGLISVYQNNVLINTTCPVAGYSVDMTSPNTGALNFFTAYSTGIPEFFLEERNTKKVKFFGSTYFHMTDMDYMWFNDARMILNKPSNYVDYNMVITACGAFGAYYGNCDVYGNCVQVGSDITHDFPNLKQYDAIYSGTAETNNYNCAAWAGGITTSWVWSSSYGSAYVWSTWDNYFGNNPARYSGAVTYTREGAYAGNAEIAVWSKNNDISGVTHFSVRGTANNHPHGYAWESKPGGYRRMFHPMNSLNGDDYGSIIAYYRDISKDVNAMSIRGSNANQSLTFEESLEKGLTVIEKVELTDIEKRLLSPSTRSATDVSISIRNIKDLFSRWEASISTPKLRILSNPYVLVSTPEAIEFIDYCKNKKFSALVFFSELYFDQREENSSEEISQLLFCKIFEEYATMIEEIKEEWKKNPYDKNGAYIAPLPETFIKKYLKALINKL